MKGLESACVVVRLPTHRVFAGIKCLDDKDSVLCYRP